MDTPKIAAQATLVAVIRTHLIYRTERGERTVGRRCGLCDARWRGRAERHKPICVLAGTEGMPEAERQARVDGWQTEAERHGVDDHHGVVHPDGWWAPDWASAVKGFGDRAVKLRPRQGDTHYRAGRDAA